MQYLERNQLLSDTQYGFRSKRSTADLLSLATQVWLRSLDEYGESRVVSLDISKAFDRVWHKGLLHKFPAYGICGAALQWISSYLSNRKMSVVLEGASSDKLTINAGVPVIKTDDIELKHEVNDFLKKSRYFKQYSRRYTAAS